MEHEPSRHSLKLEDYLGCCCDQVGLVEACCTVHLGWSFFFFHCLASLACSAVRRFVGPLENIHLGMRSVTFQPSCSMECCRYHCLKSKHLVLLIWCMAKSECFSCSFKDTLVLAVVKSCVSAPDLDMELSVATSSASDAAPDSTVSVLVVPAGSSLSWTLDPSERVPVHSHYYNYAY